VGLKLLERGGLVHASEEQEQSVGFLGFFTTDGKEMRRENSDAESRCGGAAHDFMFFYPPIHPPQADDADYSD